MKWSARAQETLDLVLRDTPPEYREGARRHTVEEIERYCEQTRIREVGSDQVVIGFIRSTPIHMRTALRNQLRLKGIMVEKYEQHFMSP